MDVSMNESRVFCEAEGGISEHWSQGLEINVFLRGGG